MSQAVQLFALGMLAANFARGQTAEGGATAYVFDAAGSWRTAPQYATDLKRGMGLRDGDVVQLRGEPDESRIHIGLIDGTVQIRDCRTLPAECGQPLKISLAHSDRSIPARIREIWSRLTLPETPSPVFTMSRGDATPDAVAAVLALRGGRPDFAPALASVTKGNYDAELTPLRPVGKTAKMDLHWTPPRATATGGSIRPGLYTLQLFEKGGEAGRSAAVLIISEGQLQSLRADFDSAAGISHNWPESMAAARKDYLAAVLDQLAARLEGSK